MKKILIVDDDALIHAFLRKGLSTLYELTTISTYEGAAAEIKRGDFDAAVIDVHLSEAKAEGVELLKLLKRKHPEKPVLIQSGFGDVATVVECMKIGAEDFVEKPFELDAFRIRLEKALRQQSEFKALKRVYEGVQAEHEIIGVSQSLIHAKKSIEEAGDLRILLVGETGVGKTPFAYLSHRIANELKKQVRPFEQVNCAVLNPEQFQDVLFGHKRGAFTGAVSDKRGLVEIADGGDLFLDEVGEMPLQVQAHFLTFLDNGEYYRLGDDQKRKSRVRVLSATNRDLAAMVKEGKFRKDLYSRLAQVTVRIPPLRERREDIAVLFRHFIKKISGFEKACASSLIEALEHQTWSDGNVRQLRDLAQHLSVLSRDSEEINVSHLQKASPMFGQETGDISTDGGDESLMATLDKVEEKVLKENLIALRGDIEGLRKKLRLSRPTLYRKLKKYGLSRFSPALH